MLEASPIYILQRGVQWKQGVVVWMVLYASLLYNTTSIHCTPLRLHPPLQSIQPKARYYYYNINYCYYYYYIINVVIVIIINIIGEGLELRMVRSGSPLRHAWPRCVYIYIYIYVMCICIYIYIYIHTYIHTYIQGTAAQRRRRAGPGATSLLLLSNVVLLTVGYYDYYYHHCDC